MIALKKAAGYKLITVTLNPVLDKTLWVHAFRAGKTFLADRSETYAGGKGVNVSRALQKFGIHSTATGIIGKNGKLMYLGLLDADTIQHDFLITDGNIRTNITVVTDQEKKETHIREKGSRLSNCVRAALEEKLQVLACEALTNKGGTPDRDSGSVIPPTSFPAGVFFIFSGSIPAGFPQAVYRDLIQTVKKYGCSAFLDTSGASLREGLKAKPLFIKPNVHEVEEACGFFPSSTRDFITAVDLFHRRGIKNVMISRGKDGLLFSRGNGIISACLKVPSPENTVGSGDAAIAGGVIGTLNNLDTEQIARLASAMGGANTLVSGACRFRVRDVEVFYDKVKINYL